MGLISDDKRDTKEQELQKRAAERAAKYSMDALIKKLIKNREADYKTPTLDTIAETEYPNIKRLVLNLGDRILKKTSTPTDQEKEAQINFHNTMEAFFKAKSKFDIVNFSAQLLQYFTIISDPNFDKGIGFQEFIDFLKNNEAKFGNTQPNLFVTEYKLIKIYNDVCIFTDATTGKLAFIPDVEQKVNFLLEELSTIKTQIDKWIKNEPDNAFVHYLDFGVNYSCAKIIELKYQMSDQDLSPDQAYFLRNSQKFFLIAAKESLKKIDFLNYAYSQEGQHQTIMSGSEFSLGQNILIKIPGADLDTLQTHISSLIR